MLLALVAPPDNPRGPRYMQEALAAIHQANHRRLPLTLEYACCDGRVGLFCRVPDQFAPIVLGPLKAKYPNCTLTAIENDHALEPSFPTATTTWSAELALAPDLFPLLRHSQFEDAHGRGFEDPIDALLQAVAPDEHTHARIQLVLRPTSRFRHWRARRAVATLDSPWLRTSDDRTQFFARFIMHPVLWPLASVCSLWMPTGNPAHRSQADTTAGRHHEREDDVQAAADKIGGHLFDVRILLRVSAAEGHHQRAHDRLHAMIGALGSFTASRLATFRVVRRRRGGFLLSNEELATLWHPPTANVAVAGMQRSSFTELEPPPRFESDAPAAEPTRGDSAIGRVAFRDDARIVTIGTEARRRHLYIVGRTGVGKSMLLLNNARSRHRRRARRGPA